MSKLFKFMKPYAGVVAAILCVLVVQAYCDLSLPTYTSDIVNVGIQQNGIDEKIPEQIGEEDLEHLLLLVPEKDQSTVKNAYTKSNKKYDTKQKVWQLKSSVKTDENKMNKLSNLLAKPMLLAAGFNSGSDMSKKIEIQMKDQMKQQMKAQMKSQMQDASQAALSSQVQPEEAKQTANASQAASQLKKSEKEIDKKIDKMSIYDIFGQMKGAQREELVKKIEKKMDKFPDSMLDQAASTYIKGAYKHIGIDMDKYESHYILNTGAKMLALAALGMIASIIVGLMASRVGAAIGRGLRRDVFRKVVGFSNGEFDKFSTASLITRSTNDIQQIQLLTVMILRMVLYAPIMAIGGITKVFHTNVDMSWIIALAVGLIVLVVAVLFFVVMPKFKIVQDLVDRLNLVSREILTGLPVIRAFSTEKHEEKRFDEANKNLTKTNLFVNRAMTFMMPTMMLIMNCITVLIVWIGGYSVNDGAMQVGDMMAFIQYTMQIIMAFLMICMISVMLPRAAVSATRVDEVLKSETKINDPETPRTFAKNEKGEVAFEHVSFRYPGAEEDVLHDLSFTAKPGETTAFIGSTGSGKSTLVNLIPRFYDVTEGRILLDGKDIRDVKLKDLRDEIGIVQQDVYLFAGTIIDNIRYGRPDATDEEVIRAAKAANAHEFIMELADGYDTDIGQRGVKLSGGQKQRLSIARVFLKNPPILIFDEATSALDNESEKVVQKSLELLAKDRTTFVIAHRLSTIRNAKRILVLTENGIAEEGTHKELLAKGGIYAHLYEMQF